VTPPTDETLAHRFSILTALGGVVAVWVFLMAEATILWYILRNRGSVPQAFKSVYYPDYPSEAHSKRSLTLAFGARDSGIFDVIKPLSSHEVRQMIGFSTWTQLHNAAEIEGLTLNRMCLRMLRRAMRPESQSTGQALLPGFKPAEVVIDPIQSTYRGGGGRTAARVVPLS
jgi:hypothetical protein